MSSPGTTAREPRSVEASPDEARGRPLLAKSARKSLRRDASRSRRAPKASFRVKPPSRAEPISRRTFLELSARVDGPRRRRGLHAPADRAHRALRQAARGGRSRASRSSSRPSMRSAATRDGLLAESHIGRPTKLEGNPSIRRASARPTRSPRRRPSVSTTPTARKSSPSSARSQTWSALRRRRCDGAAQPQKATGGAGLRILTETVTSPTLAAQIASASRDVPARRSGTSGSRRAATRCAPVRKLAFGEYVETRYDFARPTSSSRSTPTSSSMAPAPCATRGLELAAQGARRRREP